MPPRRSGPSSQRLLQAVLIALILVLLCLHAYELLHTTSDPSGAVSPRGDRGSSSGKAVPRPPRLKKRVTKKPAPGDAAKGPAPTEEEDSSVDIEDDVMGADAEEAEAQNKAAHDRMVEEVFGRDANAPLANEGELEREARLKEEAERRAAEEHDKAQEAAAHEAAADEPLDPGPPVGGDEDQADNQGDAERQRQDDELYENADDNSEADNVNLDADGQPKLKGRFDDEIPPPYDPNAGK